MNTRRGFLATMLAAACAPAIVRADSLMRIVPTDPWIGWDMGSGDFTVEAWIGKDKLQHHVITRSDGRMRGYINGIEVPRYPEYAVTEAGVLLAYASDIDTRGLA